MAAHAHAVNGKSSSSPSSSNVARIGSAVAGKAAEQKEKDEKIADLERKLFDKEQENASLHAEASKLIDANAKLAQSLESEQNAAKRRRQVDDAQIMKKAQRNARGVRELSLSLWGSRQEFASSVVHDAEEVIKQAALCGEDALGLLAMKLRDQAKRRATFAAAQIAAAAFDDADKAVDE